MQILIRKAIGLLSSGLLVAILLMSGEPGEGGGHPPEGAGLGEALTGYGDGTMKEEADEVAAQQGLIPAGDTCLMRHVNLARNVDRNLRHSFASVSLESDAAVAREALETLIAQNAGADPLVTWRLELEAARLAIRAGDIAAAKKRLDGLTAKAGIPAVCESDTVFYLSLVTHGSKVFDLLDRAASLDPASLQVHEALLVHQLKTRSSQERDCAARFTAQLESIVQLNSLVRSDRELFRLEGIALAAPKGVVADIMLGLLAEQRSDVSAAKEVFRRSLTQPNTTCGVAARYLADRRLADLEGET